MLHRFITACLLIFSLPVGAAESASDAVLQAQKRDDITGKLGTIICKQSANLNVSSGWDVGVYDAQLSGQWLSAIAKSKVADAQLGEMAKKLAVENEHFGFASSKCPDKQHAWFITTPAPQAIMLKPEDNLVVPIASLQLHCRQFRLDYAAATGGHPKTIFENTAAETSPELLMSLANLSDGTLEISCTPKTPPNRGPVVWYLLPVKKGPGNSAPHTDLVKDKKANLVNAMGVWINALRKDEKLAQLKINQSDLQKILNNQHPRVDLRHDRDELEVLRKKFRDKKRDLIGENRVLGKSLEELAYLLWISPTHRGLLLDRRAQDIIVHIEGSPTEQYFAWIVAIK